MRRIWITCLLLLLGGCPAPEPEPASPGQAEGPDEFTRFAELIQTEAGFYDELKRLQGLYTAPPSLAVAGRSDNDQRYVLSSRVEEDRLGFSLLSSATGEEWTLWGIDTPGDDQDPLIVVSDQATATGRKLEASQYGGKLLITLNARWVSGRCLQITRELMAGGHDRMDRAGEELTSWELVGPALPYRCVPATQGPYGILPDAEADGAWQSTNYPLDCMAPMIAAYDRTQGLLLGVADEHPRKLDRDYQVGYRVAMGQPGGLLRLSYRQYDPTQDLYAEPYLITGLPVRDTVVLEPFMLSAESFDSTLVEAETREVLRRMGVLVRAFHFQPRPPGQLEPGNRAILSEWVADAAGLPDAVRRLSGIWDVRAVEGVLSDAALDYGGKIGIGAAELPGGSGLAPEVSEHIGLLDPAVMPFFAYCDFLVFDTLDAYEQARPDWLVTDTAGECFSKDSGSLGPRLIDIRNPEVAAWAVRKMQADLAANPAITGYWFDNVARLPVSGQPIELGQFAASYQAVGYAALLRSAEAIQASRADARLIASQGLRLALPAFSNAYNNGDHAYVIEFGSDEWDPPLPLMNRLSNLACWELFGVEPYVAFGGCSLSAQVLGTTGRVRGHWLLRAMEEHAGFEAWADNLDRLREAGGDLQVLHSAPERNGYTGGDERPAVVDELIAVLPGDLSGDAVWLAFHGSGGAVSVSPSNELRVIWPGGEWTGQLPPGLWVVDHPSPDAVLPGDAVLIKKQPIRAPGVATPDRT